MRILILTSSTGGGHNMRANSFAHWMQRINPPTLGSAIRKSFEVTDPKSGNVSLFDQPEVQIHKCLENTHGLYRFGVAFYNWIQRTAPWMHHLYFNFLEYSSICASSDKLLGAKRFRAILNHVQPQVILSTHGSLNHGFFEVAREHLGAHRVKCVTYCGELFGKYGFSRHWVNPRADLFIGAVPESCAMARALGMPGNRTMVGGFLLRPDFYAQPMSQAQKRDFLQNRLGLDPNRFTLLLSTSEHGAHNHPALLEALYAARYWLDLDHIQVIALCGRQMETLERVKDWSQRHPRLKLEPLPRTEEMSLFMQVADAIVARPGTGTTSEAMMSGCPVIFNGLGGIMPQEWITVKFARRHQIAEQMHRPTDLPLILDRWLKEPGRLQALRENMIAARPVGHPTDILEIISKLAAQVEKTAEYTAPFEAVVKRKLVKKMHKKARFSTAPVFPIV